MARAANAVGTFQVLRVRDFALLWSGQTVSSLGDGIFTIALAIVTLDVDHHPSGIAFVFAARAIPSVLLALVGGVVVDRVPRRLVMLTSDTVRGVAVGVTALLIARSELRLWELIVMAAIFGAADSFFGPAATTIVAELLTSEQLVAGNALSQMSFQLTQGLLGPAIGGLVVAAIGTAWSFGFDAVSFAVSAVCLTLMRSRSRPATSRQTPIEDAREGLRYVRRHHWLFYSIVAAAFANFFGMAPLSVLLPLFVRETLHASALDLGLVFAAGGATGVLASLVVARRGAPRRQVSALWLAYAASGAAIAALAFAPNVFVAAFVTALEVGLMLYGDVLWFSMMQRLVPHEVLGRVSSLVYLFAASLGPLGILLGGVAATALGVRHAILWCGLLSGTICLVVLLVPGVLDPERIPDLDTSLGGATGITKAGDVPDTPERFEG
ncbi:MAG TPA: MFS transporter [Acidimicrobiales bacterium]|nr:MFS transporter [Acidimicrobiales bacterium]